MDDGRITFSKKDKRLNRCVFKMKSLNVIEFHHLEFYHWLEIEPMIDWIAENTTGKWSVSWDLWFETRPQRIGAGIDHYRTIHYKFSFEHETDAMYFSLRWK